MSFPQTRNPILIINAGKALVNKGQIFQTLYEILHEIIYENFMLEHLVDKLGFLLKKKVALIDPISWNRKIKQYSNHIETEVPLIFSLDRKSDGQD